MDKISARKQQLSLKFWIQHCRSFNNYTLCMEMAYSDLCADAGSEYICNEEEIKFTVKVFSPIKSPHYTLHSFSQLQANAMGSWWLAIHHSGHLIYYMLFSSYFCYFSNKVSNFYVFFLMTHNNKWWGITTGRKSKLVIGQIHLTEIPGHNCNEEREFTNFILQISIRHDLNDLFLCLPLCPDSVSSLFFCTFWRVSAVQSLHRE